MLDESIAVAEGVMTLVVASVGVSVSNGIDSLRLRFLLEGKSGT